MKGPALRGLLIAQREFTEHVRTRGFWFSLATVPLILLLSLAIPLIAELSRPHLAFAVTDHSGWVLEAMVLEADERDLRRLLRSDERAPRSADTPEPLAALEAAWASDDRNLERRVDALLTAPAPGPEADFIAWYRQAPVATHQALDAKAWRARFRLVHAPERWVPPGEARMNLASERIFAHLEIPEDPVGRPGEPPRPLEYAAANLTNRSLQNWLEARADAVIQRQRRQEADVPEPLWRWIDAGATVALSAVGEGGRSERASSGDVLRQWGPVAFVYILWISIQVVNQMLLSSTVEEKSGKLVEVLMASATPTDLMAGKILGIAATGMVIVGVWLTTFMAAAVGLPALLGLPGTLGIGALATDPVYLASFVVYYLLGYLFYAALLSGIGSLCATLKEAQTLAIPVQALLFVPLLAMVPIARDPSGPLASVLTWFPPFTPFVMMNRAAAPPEAWVYVGTTLLMVAAIAAALFFGARLFRIGVLTTGQAPSVRAIIGLLFARSGTDTSRGGTTP